jgi:hypothetical protein
VLVPQGVGSPAFRRRGARKEGSIKIFHPLEIINALPAEAGTPYPLPPDTGSSVKMRPPKPAFTLVPIAARRLEEKRANGDFFFGTVFREGVLLAAEN